MEVERRTLALDPLPCPDVQCNVPLGMESGRIANEQISASSTYSDERWTPQQSRLHGDDNGWTPNLDSSKEYLQVRTEIPHGVPSVSGLVGAGGGSAGVAGGGENTQPTLESSLRPSIQTRACTRHRETQPGAVLTAGIKG